MVWELRGEGPRDKHRESGSRLIGFLTMATMEVAPMRHAVIVTAMTAKLVATGAVGASLTLNVATNGNDAWSGRLPKANAARTDGPLATIVGARDAIRRLRATDSAATQPVTVLIRGGTYRMASPFVLEPQDSGTAEAPVVYEAYSGEQPILSGGRPIAGWKMGPSKVWSARVPEVAEGKWYFQQLFVNGKRRTRARSPNDGYFTIVRKAPPEVDPITGKETTQDRTAFVYSPGDLKPWPDLKEVNAIVFHSWETSRLRIAEIDEANHLVHFTGPACWPFENFGPRQRYYVENFAEALDAPGEWYLDRRSGVVTYYPMPGEDMERAEVVAPYLTRSVELRGDAELGLCVEHVTLKGLRFHYQDWTLEPQGHSDPQAAVTVPAAVIADGAPNCTIERCEVAHVGDYGIWFRRGCKNNRIVHNRVHDLGAGGVRVGEAGMAASDAAESSANVVDNNHIFDGGHVYPAGVGVWVAQSSHNTISHNEIHDLYYSGMSIGWNWGDEPNRCHHNTIEYNHVHHVMSGVLNDGGAIYTLGSSPGSIIRNNVLHDVWPYNAIGWGIYLDATCSQYLVENNIVYNTLSGSLMYNNGGHEHTIQNNVFAFSAHQMIWPYWEKRPNTFRRNILYLTQGSLFIPWAESTLKQRLKDKDPLGEWDYNVYYSPKEPELRFFSHDFSEWQALELDQHSAITDPQFVNADGYDFRLKPTSPALRLGFKQIDTSMVGLHGDAAWINEARQAKHPQTVLPVPPPPPKPTPVDDDFENTAEGAPPQGAVVSGEEQGASIRVTDEEAAGGKRSLKFTDAPGLEFAWQPHMYYQPHFVEGVVRESCDLRLERGALMFTEWRDEGTYPDTIGPSVTFDGEGKVTASGKVVAAIPVGQWVRVEIECALGKSAPRTYTLGLTPPGQPPQRFEGLPFTGKAFRELHWLGFVSTADAKAVFYVDNVKVQPMGAQTPRLP